MQIFNSGVVSGPETLVLPALSLFREPHVLIFLVEKRLGEKGLAPLQYARSLGLQAEAVVVSSRIDFGAVGRLRGTLRRLSPRVVHAHDVKATFYSWLASRGEDWKCVSTHHGVGGRPDKKTKAYEYLYSRLILPRMSMTITVSRDDEQTLISRGLDPGKVTFVQNGVACTAWAREAREAERARIRGGWAKEIPALAESDILIGMVARLSPEKRHSYFLRVLADLERRRPELPWRLIALGAGTLDAQLKSETAALGIEKKVHWFGYINDAGKYMPALDVLVFSSSAEGLPISALEAGWAATPLFSTNVGALPELIGEGDQAGGLIFPREQEPSKTAEQLAWLLERAEERRRMGETLQHRVSCHYSAEAWVKRMEIVYRSI